MATKAAHWQRDSHSTMSSWIVADGAQKVIDFLNEVLNAKELFTMYSDDKKIVTHSSIRIGDTVLMIQDGTKETAPFPVWTHVYVEDVDKTYELALSKGAESVKVPTDEFYGDRMAGVKDSAGNTWWIATHKFNPECPSGLKAQE